MSASEAPVRRLLFVADAAVAEVHDLSAEARALLSAAAEVWQKRRLEERVEERFGLPLTSYAVDPRGHATGAGRP